MEPCADMECCLKVHSKCESCMMKTIDVLRSIRGVYSVGWDAQQNLFKISGEVDPNVLLRAVLRTGEHAELVNVKLNHPQLRHRNYNYDHNYGSSNGYNRPSAYRRPYNYDEQYQYQPYNYSLQPRGQPGIRYLSSSSYDYEAPLPPATYVPSYPPQDYDANGNYEGISLCSIM